MVGCQWRKTTCESDRKTFHPATVVVVVVAAAVVVVAFGKTKRCEYQIRFRFEDVSKMSTEYQHLVLFPLLPVLMMLSLLSSLLLLL